MSTCVILSLLYFVTKLSLPLSQVLSFRFFTVNGSFSDCQSWSIVTLSMLAHRIKAMTLRWYSNLLNTKESKLLVCDQFITSTTQNRKRGLYSVCVSVQCPSSRVWRQRFHLNFFFPKAVNLILQNCTNMLHGSSLSPLFRLVRSCSCSGM